MSTERQTVCAIDIGSTKIVAIAALKEANRVRILGYGQSQSEGINNGVVKNVIHASESIKEAIEKARENTNEKFDVVFVGISSQNIESEECVHSVFIPNDNNSHTIKESDVERLSREVKENKCEKNRVILLNCNDYLIDGRIRTSNPHGFSGSQLQGHFSIVSVKQDNWNMLKEVLRLAGINKYRFVINTLASAAVCLSKEEKEKGCIFCDMGAECCDVAIFKNSSIVKLASVPFGGNNINLDLQKGLNILESQAEKLKLQFGSAICMNNYQKEVIQISGINGRTTREIIKSDVANIIYARIEEIFGGIGYILGQSKVNIKDLQCGLVLTGGTSKLNNLSSYLKFRLETEPRFACVSNIDFNKLNELRSEIYSSSIGICLKGFEFIEDIQQITERKLRQEAEEKRAAEEKERQEAEIRAKQEAEAKAKQEAEEKARKEAEAKKSDKGKKGGLFQKFAKGIGNLFTDDDFENSKN